MTSLGSYKKVPVSELLKMIGGPVTPATLAQRRAQQKVNAARRGREALRRAAGKIKASRKPPPAPPASPKPNINTLIRNANAAAARLGKSPSNTNMADYHRKRNLVINELGRANKTPRIKEILLNIRKRKNSIASNINWADKNRRWWTWQEIVAHELGAGPEPSPVVKYNPYNIPKNTGRPWKYPPPGMNTGSIARYLAARGAI